MSKNLILDLNDEQVNELLNYSMGYTQDNSENIKSLVFEKINKKRKPGLRKKVLASSLLAAALMLLSGLVYAGVIDLTKIYEKVFGSNAEYMSQFGTVIDGGNEHDGIKLNLISAVKDEDVLLVFFSLTDTDGDRLSETMDFHDRWNLDQGFGGNCRTLDYDPKTKTATFMITSVGASTNKKATLTINSFLKSLDFRMGIYQDIDISGLIPQGDLETVSHEQYSKGGLGMGIAPTSRYAESIEGLNLLKPDKISIPFTGIDWNSISNIGFVDGMLHIQTNPVDDTFSNIMSMHFADSEGNMLYTSEFRISYGEFDDKLRTGQGDYNEFIFENIHEISQIRGLSLMIDVAEYGEFYRGNWEAVFNVPPQTPKLNISADCDPDIFGEDIEIDEMLLSPLGLTIRLKGNIPNPQPENNIPAFVTYKDGTVVNLLFKSIGTFEDGCTYSFSYPIIEIEQVHSVNINGSEFDIDLD